MKFNIFGDSANEAIVLIHGEMMPWQVWHREIQVLQREYFVIVPILNAHDEDGESEFVSVKNEARSIENFILKTHDGEVLAMCGTSLGGVIANYIFGNGRVAAKKLILDNTPLVPTSPFSVGRIKKNSAAFIRNVKDRDQKTLDSFANDKLPGSFFENFLPFADTMSENSAKNIAKAICKSKLAKNGDKSADILFMYGKKSDFAVKRSAGRLTKKYPAAKTAEYGYDSCLMHTYETDEWIRTLYGFLKG